jgi:hypothetical protein
LAMQRTSRNTQSMRLAAPMLGRLRQLLFSVIGISNGCSFPGRNRWSNNTFAILPAASAVWP